MRISFTPGAALATKSRVRASGPMRASSGTRSCRREVLLAASPRCSSPWRTGRAGPRRGAKRERAALEGAGQRALGVDLADEGALALAGRRAAPSAAATVVLPTPPLPVTNSSWRSSSGVDGSGLGPSAGLSCRSRCAGRRRPCRSRRRRRLATGWPSRWPRLSVSQSTRSSPAMASSIWALRASRSVSSASSSADLTGRLGDTDANVHGVALLTVMASMRRVPSP